VTPEQENQIKIYEELIPTLDAKYIKRHKKKLSLFKEQNGECCICDRPMILRYGGTKGQYATFEHVETRSSGGTMVKTNVPLSHGTCNSRRGTEDFQTFKCLVTENNGALPPKPKSKKTLLHEAARKGDENALEYQLARKLNLEFHIMALELGYRTDALDKIDYLREALAKPINFGVN